MRKEEIERRQPWQSYIETTFNIQRRMADYYFAKAESWEELVAEHDRWLADYNTQRHWAHENREDGRRSPAEVLGPMSVVRHHPRDLERAFFSSRFVRRLDGLGYARLKHWRVYAEEGLAHREVVLWLGEEGLAVEYGGDTLSRYDVSFSPGAPRLEAVTNPRLFATRHRSPHETSPKNTRRIAGATLAKNLAAPVSLGCLRVGEQLLLEELGTSGHTGCIICQPQSLEPSLFAEGSVEIEEPRLVHHDRALE
jgi:hypothetical protein